MRGWKGALAAGVVVGAAAALRFRRPLELRGKVVIITGGSRGLGLLLARRLGARRAKLVLVARDGGELLRAREELEATGVEVELVVGDVAHPPIAEDAVAAALARWGRVDVLVNDASIIQVGPQASMSLKDFRDAMNVNFYGTLHFTLAVLPLFRKRRAGTIVNITSIGGMVPVPHMLPYTAAKFAAFGFSSGLAMEAAKDGIRVVTVVPWLMRTGSFLHALVKGKRELEAAQFTLSSTLPGLTMSAERAASRVVRAMEWGEPFVVLGSQAKLARLGFALFPTLAMRAMSTVNRALPDEHGGAGPRDEPEPIWKHRTGIAASPITALGDAAAEANNEVPHA